MDSNEVNDSKEDFSVEVAEDKEKCPKWMRYMPNPPWKDASESLNLSNVVKEIKEEDSGQKTVSSTRKSRGVLPRNAKRCNALIFTPYSKESDDSSSRRNYLNKTRLESVSISEISTLFSFTKSS